MFKICGKTLYCAECVATDPLGVIHDDDDVTVVDPNRHYDSPWYCSGCGAIVAGSLPSPEEEKEEYRLVLRDTWGSEHNVEFTDHPTPEEIADEVAEAADEELVLPEGGEIEIQWVLFLGDKEIDSDSVTVIIPPDHERLIRSVSRVSTVCGYSPEDHSWSSEGEGGLDQNPGVWSIGGTGILTREHCTECLLRREYYFPGAQALPGECDTVTYSMGEEEDL